MHTGIRRLAQIAGAIAARFRDRPFREMALQVKSAEALEAQASAIRRVTSMLARATRRGWHGAAKPRAHGFGLLRQGTEREFARASPTRRKESVNHDANGRRWALSVAQFLARCTVPNEFGRCFTLQNKGNRKANRISNGEDGIRTHVRFPVTGFQDRRLQPLGHLSCTVLRS